MIEDAISYSIDFRVDFETLAMLLKNGEKWIIKAPREKGKLRRYISYLPSQKGNYTFLESIVLQEKKVN